MAQQDISVDLAQQRRPLFWLLLVLLATVVPIVLAEGFLRLCFGDAGLTESQLRRRLDQSRNAELTEHHGRGLYGLVQASPHHDVVYELKPNLHGTFRGQSLRTNSHGLRGGEISFAKPADTFRIVGLGDSHMFGWGVGQDETYLAVLEELLNAKLGDGRLGEAIRRVEVINCGVPGYNTTMEVATFEHKCRHFEPDLVILHFIGNDFEPPHFLRPPRGLEPKQWALVNLLSALRNPDSEQDELLPHQRDRIDVETRRASRREHNYMIGRDAFRRAVQRLAVLTSERDIPVLFLMLGAGHPDRAMARRTASDHGFKIVNAAPFLDSYLADNALERTSASWRRHFTIPKDGHPSVLAHRLYAELLARRLRPHLRR